MKANHAKFGKVEILKVENTFVHIQLENGEVKQLMAFMAVLTDDAGNKIDVNAMNVMFQMPTASSKSGKKESKIASMLSEMNDHKHFDHMTKSYK